MDPCAACGGTELAPHFEVAGEAGPQGLIPTTHRFGVALSDIVRCSRCGHMQLERMPAEAELADAYSEAASEDYVAEEEAQRRTARWMLGRIERHVAPGALLDLGCWVGFLVDEAQDRGWHAMGVEPSQFASHYARARLGLDVRTAPLMEADLPRKHFRAVFMGDVIEHLLNPAAALDRVRELLEPGGVLALALPDAGSRVARLMGRRWWSVIPTHVHYFTRPSMHAVLARRGFSVLEVDTAPKAFTLRYYLGRARGYSPRLARIAIALAERAGVAGRVWAPDFRDRMLVLAAV